MTDAPAPDTFPTEAAVLRYLHAKGFALEKSALNEHVKAGMLPRRGPVPEKGRKVASFLRKDVDRYADDRLKTASTGQTKPETLEALQRQKLEEEVGRLRAIRRIKEKEDAQLEGSLIARDKVEMELAARAAVFKSDGEGFGRGEIPVLHAMILRGASVQEAIDHFLAAHAEWLDRYAQPVDFSGFVE